MQANEHPSLKMAAILHADVAGSTALVQLDESLAHERINDAFKRFSLVIEQYGGTVHEIRGDALVAEFHRATNAVCAGLAFQTLHIEMLAQLSDEIAPSVRIGVSLGEVVFADGTVTGAGVVLAQRVEQLAAPGGLCITGAIHEALPQRMPFEQEDLGERTVKGFAEPVRVYAVRLRDGEELPRPTATSEKKKIPITRWYAITIAVVLVAAGGLLAWQQSSAPVLQPASIEPVPGSLPDRPSIAVLPFTNMSGDPEQEYFADGITEDVTTDLSKISGLFVVARNSSFAYKGKSPDVRKVSRELGVRYILEGSVRRVGNQIRINAQLIDATTGGHIWAERFDGTMADVFSLQDDVNRKIVTALEVNLTVDDRKQFDKIETTNPDAYDVLLRGLEKYQRFSLETTAESRDMFKQAIEMDPNYARAYANVALTYVSDVNFNWTQDRGESIRLGLDYAARALELDDSIPQIYLTRSVLYLAQRRYDAAIEAARRTVEVHPNYTDGHAGLAFVLSYSGNFAEALTAIRRAKELNPQYSYVYLAVEGRIQFQMKQYPAALELIEKSILRNPVFDRTQLMLAAIYAELGELDDAAWAVEEALTIRSDISLADERRASNYKKPQDLNHYIDALRKAGVPEQ
jgi:adenylate cyclase